MDVLYESRTPITILEEVQIEGEAEPGLKYKAVALIDGVMSENDRFYSAEFNERCMEATNSFMESGGVVTIFSRHGKALGSFGSLPTGLPVGKVVDPLYREGNEICYHGLIVPTTEGKDMMTLIRTAVMPWNSIRADEWKSVPRELEGREVQDMVSAVLAGIDFTDNPGIKGAGVRQILEEAPEWTEETQEDSNMEWENVTLEDLQEHCPELLDEYAATKVEPVQAQATEAQAKVEELTETVTVLGEEKVTVEETAEAAKTAAEASVETANKTIADLTLKLKIAEASLIGGIARGVYEELGDKVEKEEDIEACLTEARERQMTIALASVGTGHAKGRATIPEEETDRTLSEGQERVLALAG